MKRIIYIALMMIFFFMLSIFLYFCLVYIAVYYHIVSIHYVLSFTYVAQSEFAFFLVGIFGIISGFFLGKKWWQIIYVDKVYRFGSPSGIQKIISNIKGMM